MRHLFCFVLFFSPGLFPAVLFGQNGTETVLSIAEQMPQYPGGPDSLINEITSKVVYPTQCADSNIQGKVFLRFVVNEDGSISNAQVVKGPHSLLNKTALDALKTVGKFIPGKQNGKVVKVWCSVPVNFKIKQEAKDSIEIVRSSQIKPEFPGGKIEMYRFIRKVIHYPEYEESHKIEGQVLLRVWVNEYGSLDSITVIKGVSAGIDKEAIRVVGMIPKLNPGSQNGKPIRSYLDLPITFIIIDDKETIFNYYPGGWEAYKKLIKENLRYPESEKENSLEANILIRCRVGDSLKLIPMEVLNGINKPFNEEAQRLLLLLPPLNPIVKKSRFVLNSDEFEFAVAVPFSLHYSSLRPFTFTFGKHGLTESYNIGVEKFRQQHYWDALKFFDMAIDGNSMDREAYFNRAVTKMKLNKSDACEDFKRAYLLGELDAVDGIRQTCK